MKQISKEFHALLRHGNITKSTIKEYPDRWVMTLESGELKHEIVHPKPPVLFDLPPKIQLAQHTITGRFFFMINGKEIELPTDKAECLRLIDYLKL